MLPLSHGKALTKY